MPDRILAIEVTDEQLWNEAVHTILQPDTLHTLTSLLVEKIIDLLGLQVIDPTLRHFGTSITKADERTLRFMSVTFDNDDYTDFSHSDEVRMTLTAINERLSNSGFLAKILEQATPTELRQQRRARQQ